MAPLRRWRRFGMRGLLSDPQHPPPLLGAYSKHPSFVFLCRLGSKCRVSPLLSVLVRAALILLKQSSMLGIHSIAWNIFCQTCNAERQARCCLASGKQRKGLNALLSIDLCSALKIDDGLSEPVNCLKASSLFGQGCGRCSEGILLQCYGR